jgi:hypothetical protein
VPVLGDFNIHLGSGLSDPYPEIVGKCDAGHAASRNTAVDGLLLHSQSHSGSDLASRTGDVCCGRTGRLGSIVFLRSTT